LFLFSLRVRVTTALGELTRHLHRVYPLQISQTDALLLAHEEKNPLLTGGMEFKPAGVEKHTRVPTDVKETVKDRSGRGVKKTHPIWWISRIGVRV
jgi:hypothetical protein